MVIHDFKRTIIVIRVRGLIRETNEQELSIKRFGRQPLFYYPY